VKLDDGTLGWPTLAPFARIIITAGGPEVPKPLLEQLGDPGRLLMPVGANKRFQSLVLVDKANGQITSRNICDVQFVDLVGTHGW